MSSRDPLDSFVRAALDGRVRFEPYDVEASDGVVTRRITGHRLVIDRPVPPSRETPARVPVAVWTTTFRLHGEGAETVQLAPQSFPEAAMAAMPEELAGQIGDRVDGPDGAVNARRWWTDQGVWELVQWPLPAAT